MLSEAQLRAVSAHRTQRQGGLVKLGRNCEFTWLRADSLKRDPDYQRAIRPERVEAIRRKFHEDGLGVLIVSRRADGEHYIIDGQHRDDAIIDLGMGHYLVPCIVHTGLTRQQERTMFLLLNKERLPLSRHEAFAARAAQGENLAGALHDLLRAFGLQLVGNRSNLGPREIGSVGVLEQIDGKYGEGMVERVLALVEAGWPEQPGAYRSAYLLAIASLLADPMIDEARLALGLAGCLPPQLDKLVVERVQRPNYRGHGQYALAMRDLHDQTSE